MTKVTMKDTNKPKASMYNNKGRAVDLDTQASPSTLPCKHIPLCHIAQHLGSFWHFMGSLLLSLQSAAVLICENTFECSNIIVPATRATIEKSNKSTGVRYFIYYK
jgi:hypothetical protein